MVDGIYNQVNSKVLAGCHSHNLLRLSHNEHIWLSFLIHGVSAHTGSLKSESYMSPLVSGILAGHIMGWGGL
jgi:hypothetical protein